MAEGGKDGSRMRHRSVLHLQRDGGRGGGMTRALILTRARTSCGEGDRCEA